MDYKDYFEIPKDIIYLNTPGNGLLPRAHFEWRRQWENDFYAVDGPYRDQQQVFIATVKEELGRLFHCPKEQIYAIPNFSFGLHSILSGLPQDSKVLLLEGDYPSLNYPVLSKGFSFQKVIMDENIESTIYEAIVRWKPAILMLSIVQYITGLKIDLDFIKKLKNEFPELIIVGDATQYLGTEPFDFSSSGFDVIGGSGYKWMMAGFGNGYLMLSEKVKSILFQQAQLGERPKEAMWANKSIIDTFFEPGHQDTLSHGTLLQSVRFFEEIGLSNVQTYLAELTAYAYSLFEERNWLLPEIANRAVRSSLINVQINPDLYPKLMQNGIKCFPRGTGIRIGIHLYNTKEDIDNFVRVIENIENEY